MTDENKESENEGDEIISKTIGEYGRWQLKCTFLLSLFNIPCTWHIFAPTFESADRDMWCARSSAFENTEPELWKNLTQPLGLCSIKDINSKNYTIFDNLVATINNNDFNIVTCDKWEFDGNGQTIITEFELVCDRKHLTNIAGMSFLAGVAVGGLIGGMISDRYGRKRTLIAAVFTQALLGTLISFSPVIEMFVVLRALLGFVSVSVVFSGFVLSVELVGGIWRLVAGVSYMFTVSVSYMTISGIAWFLRDWRQLQLAVSLPGFIFVGLWWILPESPLWLLAMGRKEELIAILKEAAKTNGKEFPQNIDKRLYKKSEGPTESAGVLDLFRTARMRRTTFFLAIIWFSLYMVYYGLVLNLENIGGDLYINSVISGAVEIPALAASVLILLRMGRRWPLTVTLIVSGVACLLTVPAPYLLPNSQWLVTSLAMFGKFLISSTNAVVPIFTAELYPTTIRNIGVGASNVTAGCALLLIPYLWNMAEIHQSLPMATLGLCGIIGGISVLFLPETGSAPLPVTLNKITQENVPTISGGLVNQEKQSSYYNTINKTT